MINFSVNDIEAVFMVVKILNSCFTEYEKKAKISSFSLKFDYNILEQASKVIFENDHSLCVSKILWLYYKNGHNMIIDHLHEFVSDIYKNKFYDLFFHWSWQVRNMFYYYILFFLNHKMKNLILPKSKTNRRTSSGDNNRGEEDYSETVIRLLF